MSDLNVGFFQTALCISCESTRSGDVTSSELAVSLRYLATTAAGKKKHTSATSVANVVWCDGGLLH